jgi:hypothetical protein
MTIFLNSLPINWIREDQPQEFPNKLIFEIITALSPSPGEHGPQLGKADTNGRCVLAADSAASGRRVLATSGEVFVGQRLSAAVAKHGPTPAQILRRNSVGSPVRWLAGSSLAECWAAAVARVPANSE